MTNRNDDLGTRALVRALSATAAIQAASGKLSMSYLYPALGAAVALAGFDKLTGQRGYERMFGHLDWSRDQIRAAAVAECVGGLLMMPRATRRIGGTAVTAASLALLASELRHRDPKLAVPRSIVLLAALAAVLVPDALAPHTVQQPRPGNA